MQLEFEVFFPVPLREKIPLSLGILFGKICFREESAFVRQCGTMTMAPGNNTTATWTFTRGVARPAGDRGGAQVQL